VEELLIRDISLVFNRKKGKFSLSVQGKSIDQNVCEFLQTVSFLVGKNIEEYLLNTDSQYDNVRIPLTGCGKVITLPLTDFISFREAYGRQMYMLKLEDMLMHRGIRMTTDRS
jgi:hypothetical protein